MPAPVLGGGSSGSGLKLFRRPTPGCLGWLGVNQVPQELEFGKLISEVRNQPFALGASEDSNVPVILTPSFSATRGPANLIYEQKLGVKVSSQDNCRSFATVELSCQGGDGQIICGC